ncbi:restriction endonuclease subunit S [Staphylococcus capitis]|uniref:restriction endonuclease subunit S n=1 Tax=Staphylococcus TaxID=1279 RepID=UPI00068ABCDA|nr:MULTISPECIES: restriction endonuclease subunit S [Staphylococcus]MDS0178519.1 restriction endonuclease subunit S [Staphylococcus capitis]MDS0191397.1 restriction endonuclease subunit S [Staphylococcus capitis]MDS0196213.1 restriction endonuclease subunit S [Staphylococcus capitis]MDS0230478.1 restriction endonuclease subunit S [Staphylococcus capitis]MDS0263035.1 restriction endonuclease subunit S [Staphylococcus capitis]
MIKLEDDFVNNGGKFKKVRIGDLFEVSTGSQVAAKSLKDGIIYRVSAKSDNNGIIGTYNTENIKSARHFNNFISVNFFGNCFYHPYKASVEMKVHVLKLSNYDFNKGSGIYIASSINRLLKGKYGYGNQLSSTKLKNEDFFIELPFKNDEICFEYMEKYIEELEAERIEELEAERIEELEAYLQVTGLSDYNITEKEKEVLDTYVSAYKNSKAAQNRTIKTYNSKELFGNATRGKRLKSSDRITGNLPFITAGESKAGISGYISNGVQIFDSNTITIDMFGSAKYRNFEYGADDHVAVIDTSKYSLEVGLFLTTAYNKSANTGIFSYAKNFYATDADALMLSLPTSENNTPDYELMCQLIKVVEKQCIKEVIEYSRLKLEIAKKIIGK